MPQGEGVIDYVKCSGGPGKREAGLKNAEAMDDLGKNSLGGTAGMKAQTNGLGEAARRCRGNSGYR